MDLLFILFRKQLHKKQKDETPVEQEKKSNNEDDDAQEKNSCDGIKRCIDDRRSRRQYLVGGTGHDLVHFGTAGMKSMLDPQFKLVDGLVYVLDHEGKVGAKGDDGMR